MFDLSEIKFKEIDELVEIFKSWNSKVKFDIELHRDQRLRYLFGKRYDYRTNLIDWDYQMGVKPVVPIVHWYHYRDWRNTGVAFEQGFSRYIQSNRTLGSYIPGKKVFLFYFRNQPEKVVLSEDTGAILLLVRLFPTESKLITNLKKLNFSKSQIYSKSV
jgi:hypothetical protein